MGGLVLLTFVVCVFGWPIITVLPAYTKLRLGREVDAFSLLLSAIGAGSLLAALTTATFGSAGRRGIFLLLGVGAGAVGLAGLGFASQAWVAVACCIATGFGLILYLSIGQSTLQLAIPDEKRGRVMALWAMTLSASAPIGHLLAGEAITQYGVGPVLLGMASGIAVATLVLAAILAIRGLR
jgi:hypothetical protein